MTKPIELAVVMPIYNEETNLETVVMEWLNEFNRLGISFVLLAINDGSRDGTAEALQKLAKRYPDQVIPVNKQNAGHGQACRTGYSLAIAQDSIWTFQIDSDGQCDSRFFSSFWEGREEADCIFGRRATRDDGISRSILSGVCRFATSLLSGMDLGDANVPYRLMRTSALKAALPKIPDDFNMQNVALTVALKRDPHLRWKYVSIHFRNRQGGTNSINLRNIAGMGLELLTNLHKISR